MLRGQHNYWWLEIYHRIKKYFRLNGTSGAHLTQSSSLTEEGPAPKRDLLVTLLPFQLLAIYLLQIRVSSSKSITTLKK